MNKRFKRLVAWYVRWVIAIVFGGIENYIKFVVENSPK